jgi:para-aminobenzoate synthetase component 1
LPDHLKINPELRRKLLHWAAAHPYCMVLDSCGTWVDRYGQYELLVAVAGEDAEAILDAAALDAALHRHPARWLFGGLSYDLKNKLEPRLSTTGEAAVPFPELCFFAAQAVIALPKGEDHLQFLLGDAQKLTEEIHRAQPEAATIIGFRGFESNFSREAYLDTVSRLRAHIREGDCYEINLTQNFTADCRIHHPVALWEDLTALSPVPFAGYARWKDIHLLCASPERFLQLRGNRLLTQPIKGTATRGNRLSADLGQMRRLRSSQKEQAENVMIVDLSRNDLYRSCEVNSVEVPELFEIQTFPQVHHLVSTVTGRKRSDISPLQAIRHTFPPGSMTGAPKVRTCELIDHYEKRPRGIYSGSIGYFQPGEGGSHEFDLNVVIRSLVCDASRERISYHVGGAVTWDSDPRAEYEETLVKAKAIAALFERAAE